MYSHPNEKALHWHPLVEHYRVQDYADGMIYLARNTLMEFHKELPMLSLRESHSSSTHQHKPPVFCVNCQQQQINENIHFLDGVEESCKYCQDRIRRPPFSGN